MRTFLNPQVYNTWWIIGFNREKSSPFCVVQIHFVSSPLHNYSIRLMLSPPAAKLGRVRHIPSYKVPIWVQDHLRGLYSRVKNKRKK